MTLNQNKDATIAACMRNWQFENFPQKLKGLLNKDRDIEGLKIENEYPTGVYRKVEKRKNVISEIFSSFFVMSYSAEELERIRSKNTYHYKPHLYSKN